MKKANSNVSELAGILSDLTPEEKIESLMKEGYLATKVARAELNADWQTVDTEGWTE